MPGPFTSDEIREFLADGGYTSNPDGLFEPWPVEYVYVSEYAAYLDINADAVRKDSVVPDRPVRITFHKISDGTNSLWKVKSVGELAPGIESKCLARQPETPKISPWPNKKPKKGE
jgi:hypothetical protein